VGPLLVVPPDDPGGEAVKYRTIVADPPWEYPEGFATVPDRPRPAARAAGVATTAATIITRALPYGSLSLEAMCDLPVRELAEKRAHLFLWTTNRYLRDAFDVVEAWGFSYRQLIVWAKPPGSRPPFRGTVAPNCAEYLLACRRGGGVLLGPAWPSNVVEIARPSGHSQKPEAFLDLVEQVSPGPYLEMFARRQRLGWDTWGNEALNHVEIA
jgi:N6-adenosine-specific RNA methylase IME4